MPTFVAAIDWWREEYTDGNDSKGDYLVTQAARDTSTVQYKYRTQHAHSRLSGDENLCPWTDECHLLHSHMVPCTSRSMDTQPQAMFWWFQMETMVTATSAVLVGAIHPCTTFSDCFSVLWTSSNLFLLKYVIASSSLQLKIWVPQLVACPSKRFAM